MTRLRSIRRALPLLAAGLTLAVAISPSLVSPSLAQPESEFVHYRRIDLPSPWGEQRVLVTYPRRADRMPHPPGERYPLLVALHGRGEARPARRAHVAWASVYRLPDAFAALMRGRVGNADYRGFVRPEHLEYVNERLRAEPFRGVMVVTPYVPDVMGEPLGSARMRELGDWLAGPLLEAVRARFDGAARTREGTGIDGISMGGRVALEVGLAHPESFGAVSAMQPAIRGHEDALAERAAGVAHPQHLRLLSSDDDPLLEPTRRLSRALGERRLRHTLSVVPGPHDYAFNRGPAGLEMLLFHDGALAHEPLQ